MLVAAGPPPPPPPAPPAAAAAAVPPLLDGEAGGLVAIDCSIVAAAVVHALDSRPGRRLALAVLPLAVRATCTAAVADAIFAEFHRVGGARNFVLAWPALFSFFALVGAGVLPVVAEGETARITGPTAAQVADARDVLEFEHCRPGFIGLATGQEGRYRRCPVAIRCS